MRTLDHRMFTSRKSKISELYNKILCRNADTGGLNAYDKSNLQISEIERILFRSDEYKNLITRAYAKNFPLINVPLRGKVHDWLPSVTNQFYDIDKESLFEQNKLKYGKDWIWYDSNKISYKFNSHGYRMKEFDQINQSNYIVTLGCSNTFGLGLPLEETFAYKIADKLRCDLVNAAVCGGSNDIIINNLTRILKNENKPKQIIINWTLPGRKSFWVHPGNHVIGLPNQLPKTWVDSYEEYLNMNNTWEYYFREHRLLAQTMCKLAGVDLWEFTFFQNSTTPNLKIIEWVMDMTKLNDISYVNNMFARDINSKIGVVHPGIYWQDIAVSEWETTQESFK
tara:strand:+ start:3271 stop:4287 length:1017 start_codon:yes stop_codon:yes gene_type:complete